jgi:DNA-binding response OmpR family regulator
VEGSARLPHVLLVDDEQNCLRTLAIGLRLEGFVVETAACAAAARKALLSSSCDIAIVDLMMPGTNGLDLAREMRRHHPQLRVVLTSAYHLSERQLARADCGVVGFVPKPYSLTELAAFLKSKLASSSQPPTATVVANLAGEPRTPIDTHSGTR